jgi:multicomponent Na+:H+ antiporter subunit A
MLTIAVLAGFVLAPLALLAQRLVGDRSGWLTAPVPAGVAAVVIAGTPTVAAGRPLVEATRWVPMSGVEPAFRLDGLSLVMAPLVTVVGTLVQIDAGGSVAGKAHAARQGHRDPLRTAVLCFSACPSQPSAVVVDLA